MVSVGVGVGVGAGVGTGAVLGVVGVVVIAVAPSPRRIWHVTCFPADSSILPPVSFWPSLAAFFSGPATSPTDSSPVTDSLCTPRRGCRTLRRRFRNSWPPSCLSRYVRTYESHASAAPE